MPYPDEPRDPYTDAWAARRHARVERRAERRAQRRAWRDERRALRDADWGGDMRGLRGWYGFADPGPTPQRRQLEEMMRQVQALSDRVTVIERTVVENDRSASLDMERIRRAQSSPPA